MNFREKDIYHIYNRGNNSQLIFFEKENYLHFIRLTKKFISPQGDILAWCLMPNHFHFLVHANENSAYYLPDKNIPIQGLSEGIRLLLSSYAKAINKKYERKGNLFQQKTKSKNIYEGKKDYGIQVFNYIHQNPVKAFLCTDPPGWEFSSSRDYAGLRKDSFCNIELAKKLLGL